MNVINNDVAVLALPYSTLRDDTPGEEFRL